jgi:hypothetical protein
MAEQVTVLTPSGAGLADQLGLYKTYLAAAKVRLFKSSFVPTPDSDVAAFIAAEANFAGYAAGLPTYSAVGIDATGNYVFVTSRLFYQATDAVTPNDIGGFWLESAGGVLQCFGIFAAPISLNAALKFLALTLDMYGVPGGTSQAEY